MRGLQRRGASGTVAEVRAAPYASASFPFPMHAYLSPAQAPSRDDLERGKGVVLLEFGTAWCGYCRAIAPIVEPQLAAHAHVQHVKVEDAAGYRLGRSFAVKLWPTLVFLKDGQVLTRLVRPSRKEILDAFSAASLSSGGNLGGPDTAGHSR